MTSKTCRVVIWVMISACLVYPTQAATITAVNRVVGDGVVDVLVVAPDTLDPNDDNNAFSLNFAAYELRFDQTVAADIEFEVQDSLGTTQYDLFVTLVNESGTDWIGQSVELGFGVTDQFRASDNHDGLSFDTDESDPLAERDSLVDSANFVLDQHLDNKITWGSGLVYSGRIDDLIFSFDLPDLPNEDRFTLRFQPLVEEVAPPIPEPAMGTLFLMVGISVFARRWPRREATIV